MWELIEFTKGNSEILGFFSDFDTCMYAAIVRMFLTDGMTVVDCMVSL